jgi:hypothetical protein
MSLSERTAAHLNTRFLFPFSVDVKEAKAARQHVWSGLKNALIRKC